MPNHADLIKRLEENWHKVECLFGQAETAKTARDRGYFLGLARHRFQDMQADIREAAAALRELTEWRLMESADKIKETGEHVMLAMMEDGPPHGWVAEGYWDVYNETWHMANTHWADQFDGQIFPTHWRSLPLPPEPEGE